MLIDMCMCTNTCLDSNHLPQPTNPSNTQQQPQKKKIKNATIVQENCSIHADGRVSANESASNTTFARYRTKQ